MQWKLSNLDLSALSNHTESKEYMSLLSAELEYIMYFRVFPIDAWAHIRSNCLKVLVASPKRLVTSVVAFTSHVMSPPR